VRKLLPCVCCWVRQITSSVPFQKSRKHAASVGRHQQSASKSGAEYGIKLNTGRLESSRLAYRLGQLRALERGSHSSFHRHGAKAPPNNVQPLEGAAKMDAKVRDRYPTLDRATDRIAELEHELGKRSSQVSGNTGTRSIPKPHNQTAQTATAPKLTDLSMPELKAANGYRQS
jgi:hypothetical protein